MPNPVSPTSTGLSALTAMIATGGPLHGCKVSLYTNNVTPSPGSNVATFTVATYTGYAAVVVGTWGSPFIDTDGLATIEAPGIQFQPTDAVAPNTIYGVFVTDSTGATLIFATRLNAPVSLPDAQHALVYSPEYKYGA